MKYLGFTLFLIQVFVFLSLSFYFLLWIWIESLHNNNILEFNICMFNNKNGRNIVLILKIEHSIRTRCCVAYRLLSGSICLWCTSFADRFQFFLLLIFYWLVPTFFQFKLSISTAAQSWSNSWTWPTHFHAVPNLSTIQNFIPQRTWDCLWLSAAWDQD